MRHRYQHVPVRGRPTRGRRRRVAPALLALAALLVGATACYPYPPLPGSGACADRRPLALADPTLGVHGLADPAVAEALGADLVRIILHDAGIAAARAELAAGGEPEMVRNLEGFAAAGIDVVVTLRWPVTPGDPGGADRVPEGADRADALEQVAWVVTTMGPLVDAFQLGNEVMGGPGWYPPHQAAAAVAFYDEVAEVVCSLRTADPALGHLRLVSPALTGLDGAASGSATPDVEAAIAAIVDFAERRTDLLDVHLHADDAESIDTQLAWLRGRTAHPLVALEWSQAKAARWWLNRPPASPWRHLGATNREVVEAAYETPMAPADWAAFVAGAPHDDGFLREALAVMASHEVQLAAYGGAFQFGQPLYDLKALFAQHTTGRRTPNQPFFDEFVALASP